MRHNGVSMCQHPDQHGVATSRAGVVLRQSEARSEQRGIQDEPASLRPRDLGVVVRHIDKLRGCEVVDVSGGIVRSQLVGDQALDSLNLIGIKEVDAEGTDVRLASIGTKLEDPYVSGADGRNLGAILCC